MLTQKEIEEIKFRREGLREVVETKLSKLNPYEIMDIVLDDVDKLVETLEKYMDSRKLTIGRPPWKCCGMNTNGVCNELIYHFKYIDSGPEQGCFEVKCSKCGNVFYS